MLSKNIALLTYSNIAFVISAYLVNVIVGRLLGPDSYGVLGIVISIMSIVNLLQISGIPQAVSKLVSEDEEKSDTILKSGLHLQLISTLVLTSVYFFLAGPIAILLKDISLVPYIRLSALIYPTYGLFAFYVGYFNGLHNFKKQSVLNIVYSVFKTISVIGLAIVFKVNGAIIGFIIAPLIALFFGIKLPGKNVGRFSYEKLIALSIPLIGFALFITALQSIDLYFIKSLLRSNELVGFYTANQNIARIPFFALGAFSTVLFPSISKSVSGNDSNKTKRMIQTSLRYILILLMPATLIISATSKEIVVLLFSDSYSFAAPSLSVLIFSSAFLTIFSVCSNILNGAGHQNKSLYISFFGVIVTAIFCILLIPKYGLIGAATATGIGGFLAMAISLYYVYRKFEILVSLKDLLKITFASLVVYFITLNYHLPVVVLPIFYMFIFIIDFIILIILKEINKEDFSLIKNLIPVSILNRINKFGIPT